MKQRSRLYDAAALATEQPNRPAHRRDLAILHAEMAQVLETAGRLAEEDGSWHLAQALDERLAESQPAVPEHRARLAQGPRALARLHAARGRAAQAPGMLQRAEAVTTKLVNDDPQENIFRTLLELIQLDLRVATRDPG